ARRRPSLCHGLHACIEPHAFHAVDVMVAEERIAPAAEAEERHRDRKRYVDTHHPDFNPETKVRAAAPERVNTAVPFANGWELIRLIAASMVGTRIIPSTGPKISS